MVASRGWTIGQTALGVAYTALGLAALMVPPDREAVVSLVVVGHVLSGLVLLRGAHRPGLSSTRPRCVVTVATAGVCATGELVGWWLCTRASEADFACWFLLATSFAVATMVIALHQEPGDAAFIAQLMFHGLMLAPLLALMAHGVLSRQPLLDGSGRSASGARPLLRVAVLAGFIPAPVVVPFAAGAVLGNLAQANPRWRSAWNALLLHEAAFVVLLGRWALALS